MELNKKSKTIIQDRTIYEDAEIFCTHLHRSRKIKKRDYETYMELYRTMRNVLQPPDLMIYLRCSVRAIRRRIKSRARPSEQTIPTRYIRNLNNLYEEWISQYNISPVMIWDSGNKDYLTDIVDQIQFHKNIKKFL